MNIEQILKKFPRVWVSYNPSPWDRTERVDCTEGFLEALTTLQAEHEREMGERISWLDRIEKAYSDVEKKGEPSDLMLTQIHGFRQAYGIIKNGNIDNLQAIATRRGLLKEVTEGDK